MVLIQTQAGIMKQWTGRSALDCISTHLTSDSEFRHDVYCTYYDLVLSAFIRPLFVPIYPWIDASSDG